MAGGFKERLLEEKNILVGNGISRTSAHIIAGVRVWNEMVWKQGVLEEEIGITDDDFWKKMGYIEKLFVPRVMDATREENIKK